MDYEREAAEFLARPENLPIALEVAKRVEQAKNYLQIRFWHMYCDEMERRLHAANTSGRWSIWLIPEKNMLDAWARCRIDYRPINNSSLRLNVNLQAGQPRYDCYLHYGLCWSQSQKTTPDLPAVVDMMGMLKTRGFTINPSEWWLMVINLDYGLRDEKFLIRFVSEPKQIVNEIADTVWSLFEQIREPLEALNEALASSSA